MISNHYDGTTKLGYQITEVLKLCKYNNPKKISDLTKEACTALGYPLDTKGGGKPSAHNVAIFEWLRDNKATAAESIDSPEKLLMFDLIIDDDNATDLFALETENVIMPMGINAILPDMTVEEAQAKHAELKSIHSIARTMLLEMRDRKGWLALGYSSFSEYGEKEWGYTQSYISRLTAAARIQNVIMPMGINEMPERQTRELGKLPNDDAMREVIKSQPIDSEVVTQS